MFRTPARCRVALACVALAVTLAACGTVVEPGVAHPDSTPNLLDAPADPAPVDPAAAAPPAGTGPDDAAAGPGSAADDRLDPATGGAWAPAGGDEFDGGALDPARWQAYDSVGGFGNGLRRPSAVTQTGGALRITGAGQVSGGIAYETGQLYGRWDFRARTEKGRGWGSAILLWPDSEQFPRDGEIDLMEVPDENRGLAYGVLHHGLEDQLDGKSAPGDFTQWHTFTVEWLPGRITWYIDGAKTHEVTNRAAIPKTPMHMAIQLDRGPKKNWMPAPDATTPPEVSLEVDWVRISKL